MSDGGAAQRFSSGIIGVQQVAVIGATGLAMLGFGVAAQHGAQLRPRVRDGVFPKAWGLRMDHAADAATAGALAALARLVGAMVVERARLGDGASALAG